MNIQKTSESAWIIVVPAHLERRNWLNQLELTMQTRCPDSIQLEDGKVIEKGLAKRRSLERIRRSHSFVPQWFVIEPGQLIWIEFRDSLHKVEGNLTLVVPESLPPRKSLPSKLGDPNLKGRKFYRHLRDDLGFKSISKY
ncbi:MAG TPA: hypothetical protein VJK25_03005 [Patescibacteria group bacterium]|nr:hypothetical protein [Patescibacteria group bacterium]